MSNLYLDIHVIQTVPPSCINRDDTGSPKTAVYGGTTRARVSSQAWKKAMRDYFKEVMPKEKLGLRTKFIVNTIADTVIEMDNSILNDYNLQEKIRETINLASTDKKKPIIPSTKPKDMLKDLEDAFNDNKDNADMQEQMTNELSEVCKDLGIELNEKMKFSDMKKQIGKQIPTKKEATEDEINEAERRVKDSLIKFVETIKSNIENDALFFFGYDEKIGIAKLVLGWCKDDSKKPNPIDVKTILNYESKSPEFALDIALFGRMIAKAPRLNIDASSQIAHAISTHKVINEFDYFTAEDEEKSKYDDKGGASMIGSIEFNSSTLYRYATVALHDLKTYVGDNTANAAAIFTKAFICSMPTGKQNTFASRTMPKAVYICLREDQPINLVDAFETAVSSKDEGFVRLSLNKLALRAKEIYENWADEPVKSFAVGGFETEDFNLGEKTNFKELPEKLLSFISEKL
jgi:CRISPR system Cascade subunit CasC